MADNAAPILLLTRPRAAAERFAARCRAELRGPVNLIVAPLMEIRPVATSIDLAGVTALIFTSEIAVTLFAGQTVRRDIPAYCVGDRTTQVARDIGLSARSAAGDADALITMIRSDPPGGPLLHLRGAYTRGDVVPRLTAAGLSASDLVIYEQVDLPPDPAFLDALATGRPVLVPLFSPRSATLFAKAANRDLPANIRPITMSDAVRMALPPAWRNDAIVAASPDAPAMISALNALISR